MNPHCRKGVEVVMFLPAAVWQPAFLMLGKGGGQSSSLIVSGYWTCNMETSTRAAAPRAASSQLSDCRFGIRNLIDYSSYYPSFINKDILYQTPRVFYRFCSSFNCHDALYFKGKHEEIHQVVSEASSLAWVTSGACFSRTHIPKQGKEGVRLNHWWTYVTEKERCMKRMP